MLNGLMVTKHVSQMILHACKLSYFITEMIDINSIRVQLYLKDCHIPPPCYPLLASCTPSYTVHTNTGGSDDHVVRH